MWDWSNSKRTSSGSDLSKEDTKKELDDLFSFDGVAAGNVSSQKDPARKEDDSDKTVNLVEEKPRGTSFTMESFSANRTLKSGAAETMPPPAKKTDTLSNAVRSIPPPPPAVKGTTPFIRPTVSKPKEPSVHVEEDRAEVSSLYAGAMGIREEVPPHGDKSMWELQLRQAGLPGMALAEVSYSPLDKDWHLDMIKGFKRIRRDFFKYVAYHNLDDLVTAGVSDEGIKMLKTGRAPENFDIHIKIPLEYGGNNEFSNLCLIQTRPFHEGIHKFVDMQTSNLREGEILRSIFIPIPKGKVYIPEVEITVGGGRKMADKSVYAGFLADTFKEIAIKTMYGRSRDL